MVNVQPAGAGLRPGTTEHKDRFCSAFVDTHVPYEVSSIVWPELSDDDRKTLVELPIWDEAVNTEHETAVLVRVMADHERDARLAEAIGLQAFEEERHAALVSALTDRYGIDVDRRPTPAISDPEWAFLKSGWGECIDSFFAFGVYGVARDSGMVGPELLAIFDLVMQEEARHIVFFENWRLYHRYADKRVSAAALSSRGFLAACSVVVDRLRLAASNARGSAVGDQNFMLAGARALGRLTPRDFVDVCLRENERRLGGTDPSLVRPRIVPFLARSIRRLLPDRPFAVGVGTTYADPVDPSPGLVCSPR